MFVGKLAVVGNIEYTGTITDISDARLKTDVNEAPYGLDAVKRLRSVSFKDPGDKTGRTQLGLIAQEVEPIIPELVVVRHEADGDILSLAYVEVIPVLIKAIQEQQARIEALEGGASGGQPAALAVAKEEPGAAPVAPAATVIREASAFPASAVWALAAMLGLFALSIFALAGAVMRRKS